MPAYDCGDEECTECGRAFGPDRRKAIENYKRREAFYATLPQPSQESNYGKDQILVVGRSAMVLRSRR